MKNKDSLSTAEALVIINNNLKSVGRKPVSRSSVLKYCLKGQLKHARFGGPKGPIVIMRADAEAFLPKRQGNPNLQTG